MKLNHEQLDKLNKNDLIKYVLTLQENQEDTTKISNKLDEALAEISKIYKFVEQLQSDYTKLESTLMVTKNVNDKLLERIEDLERQVNSNAQYSRRECLEIAGIPSSVENNDL